MSSEDYVEVPPDSTGKKLRALKKNVGGNDVYDEVVAVEDGSGNIIDLRKNVEVTGLVVVGASALPTGAATESTLGSVKAKTDNLDTPLSGVKSKTDNIPADPAREGGNLASIKSKTDNIDVALSTRALETGGNLATLAGKDFATQTTLALIKAKTDNVDAALSTRALETGGNLATIAGKDFATQTTLALIKAKTDNIDVLLSTRLKSSDVVTAQQTTRTSMTVKGEREDLISLGGSVSPNNAGIQIVPPDGTKKIKVYDAGFHALVDGNHCFYFGTATTLSTKRFCTTSKLGLMHQTFVQPRVSDAGDGLYIYASVNESDGVLYDVGYVQE